MKKINLSAVTPAMLTTQIPEAEKLAVYNAWNNGDITNKEAAARINALYNKYINNGAVLGTFESGSPIEPVGDIHEYVDLGLPSGTLWATCNIGAENPEDAGLYFQWGDTQGYTAAQVGTDKVFDWANYKYSSDGSSSVMTKYNSSDGKTVLDNEDDAAYVIWGSEWKMPTLADINELIDNTTYEVVTDAEENKIGMRFSGNGNSIFVPFAGRVVSGNVDGVGREGYCWSSSLFSGSISNAHVLFVDYGGVAGTGIGERYYGFCVRPVRSSNP